MDFEPIELNGSRLEVKVLRTQNKNSYAKLKNGFISIEIPERMSFIQATTTAKNLYRRMADSLKEEPAPKEQVKLIFYDNQKLNILGKEFKIYIKRNELKNARVSCSDSIINVSVPANWQENETEKALGVLVRRAINVGIKENLSYYVNELNRKHVGSEIADVRISGATALWGTCSKNNVISLNFKLLLMPERFLEYVTVHELSHTKHRNHSKAFWKKVEGALPNYKQTRKELKGYKA